ncbi:MAG: DNA/RNA nuclease SfsA [Bacillota bacterium]|nr:DNA/RNA nuclease SfsA [Bacillota bacterium]
MSQDLLASVFVPFPSPLEEVVLLRRPNRFLILARREGGEEVPLHLPNSGRMEELLLPGARGLAFPTHHPKTKGTLLLVEHKGRWVSVDARMPNRLLEEGLRRRAWPFAQDVTSWKREAALSSARIDFRLDRAQGPLFVETKSCNRVEGSLALFPDAPTQRGTRHLVLLRELREKGIPTGVIWFVQRDDARALSPDHKADPSFARAFWEGVAAGMMALAYGCQVTPEGIRVLDSIPIVERKRGREGDAPRPPKPLRP